MQNIKWRSCAFALVFGVGAGLVHAQPLGPVEVIPITKVREHYNYPAEDGRGKSCGVKLYGEFPVYKNYTNHSAYTLLTPGLQSNPHGGSDPWRPRSEGR
jgi:hypothetical protein